MDEIKQKSEEWRRLRAGKVTCSILSDVVAVRQKGEGELAGRRTARLRAITQRLSDELLPEFNNASTAWGERWEGAARQAYEIATGNIIEEVGFVEHLTIYGFGGSPDGVVRNASGRVVGGVEIKCPHAGVEHVAAIASGEMSDDHWDQVQGSIFLNEAEWWDFVSFDPRMPEPLRLFVRRIWRDDDYINSTIIPAVKQLIVDIDHDTNEILCMDQSRMLYDGTDSRETWLKRRADARAAAEAKAAELLRIKEEEKAAKAAAKAAEKAAKGGKA